MFRKALLKSIKWIVSQRSVIFERNIALHNCSISYLEALFQEDGKALRKLSREKQMWDPVELKLQVFTRQLYQVQTLPRVLL